MFPQGSHTLSRAIGIAFAVIGVIVGAGFASGQEMLQYFVAFGTTGIVGVGLAGIVMVVGAIAMVQLGSYLSADEHTAVYNRISHPIVARLLDVSTVITLFGVGFIMFSGGGANLQQQFGLPTWVGTALIFVAVLAAGFLDVDKVSTLLGFATPFIIILIGVAGIYSLLTVQTPVTQLNEASQDVLSTLPNWWLSALNYVGFNGLTAVSMAIVIGGSHLDTRAGGLGGLLAGVFFSALLVCATVALFLHVDVVGADDMPMLSVINAVHPWLGTFMSVVIFLMIFNTALGEFYALAKRLSRSRPQRFHPIYVVAVTVGFVLGFLPFRQLVAYVFPVLGYLGIIMLVTISVAWFRGRNRIREETHRRRRALDLTLQKLDPRRPFTRTEARELKQAAHDSNLPDKEFASRMREEAELELSHGEEPEGDSSASATPPDGGA